VVRPEENKSNRDSNVGIYFSIENALKIEMRTRMDKKY